jgi:hypothetical protein
LAGELTDGLTPEKEWQAPFIQRLSETGNVSAACRKARISRTRAYVVRDEDEAFKSAWDEALLVATEALELEARRRAMGYLESVYHQGEKVGSIRRYSDTLMIFLLKAHAPEKYRDKVDITSGGEPLFIKLDQ